MPATPRRSRFPDSELLPGTPRSRVATAVGIVLLLATLGALVWFAASNTETRDQAPRAVPAPSG